MNHERINKIGINKKNTYCSLKSNKGGSNIKDFEDSWSSCMLEKRRKCVLEKSFIYIQLNAELH